MFRKSDRSILNSICSQIRDDNFENRYNTRCVEIQQERIVNQQKIIDSLLDVLCEKYTDQTLIIGFGQNIHPIVVRNGERINEDNLKSIHYEWLGHENESIHIEYKK